MTEGEITRQQSGGRNQDPTLVDAPRDGFLGSTIAGKYRIGSKLGAGGMGAVYRATRLLIGDEIAVKILHTEQGDPRAAERFRREAQAAARLKHPNAVNIYDFGVTDDGLQYLVMELVEGESLRQIMKKQGTIKPTVCAWIISEACAALDEAHRHNIIHRDIKPDNLIVNDTTSGPRVKVLDFGIAKLRDDAGGNLTQTGSILGTLHYMSPEQCLGEDLDGRSDIYSLGVVLYEMLCGVVPFHSAIPSAVVVQHVNQPPPSLRSKDPSISQAVDRVVLRALAKQRDARPGTAAILAHELTDAVNESIGASDQASEEATRIAEGDRQRKRAERARREAEARPNRGRTKGASGVPPTVRVGPPTIGRAVKSPSSVSRHARIDTQGFRALVCLVIGLFLLFLVRFQWIWFLWPLVVLALLVIFLGVIMAHYALRTMRESFDEAHPLRRYPLAQGAAFWSIVCGGGYGVYLILTAL